MTGKPAKKPTPGREVKLVVGGESRANLLPPEITARAKSRSTRRALVGLVVLSALVATGGVAASGVGIAASEMVLAAEEAKTGLLIKQQGEFVGVGQVENRLLTATAAKRVAASTEIDWLDRVTEVRTALPTTSGILGFSVETATPLAPYTQPGVPLQGPRVGTLIFEIASPDLPDVAVWMEELESNVTGFSDAVVGEIGEVEEGAGYQTLLTIHIDDRAYADRFETSTEEPK